MAEVAQTSLLAYDALQQSPLLGSMQLEVFWLLRRVRNATDREIEAALPHLRENVRKRRNELVKAGYVVLAEERECAITHRISKAWKVQ